jgi:hypothetical protein
MVYKTVGKPRRNRGLPLIATGWFVVNHSYHRFKFNFFENLRKKIILHKSVENRKNRSALRSNRVENHFSNRSNCFDRKN